MGRLDEFAVGPVGFLKLDVEGHEPEVLVGAEETIRRDRPSILLEAEERHRADALGSARSILEKQHGYLGLFVRGSRKSDNFLFLPAERAIALRDSLDRILVRSNCSVEVLTGPSMK